MSHTSTTTTRQGQKSGPLLRRRSNGEHKISLVGSVEASSDALPLRSKRSDTQVTRRFLLGEVASRPSESPRRDMSATEEDTTSSAQLSGTEESSERSRTDADLEASVLDTLTDTVLTGQLASLKTLSRLRMCAIFKSTHSSMATVWCSVHLVARGCAASVSIRIGPRRCSTTRSKSARLRRWRTLPAAMPSEDVRHLQQRRWLRTR